MLLALVADVRLYQPLSLSVLLLVGLQDQSENLVEERGIIDLVLAEFGAVMELRITLLHLNLL